MPREIVITNGKVYRTDRTRWATPAYNYERLYEIFERVFMGGAVIDPNTRPFSLKDI